MSVRVLARFDDGLAVYLDGVELGRLYLPAGPLSAESLATATVSGHAEAEWREIEAPGWTLAEGEAVVAVEVHQSSVLSSDLNLDLSLRLVRLAEVE